jgi:methylated-DNA-protein-cysteine methyltransferase-like protein
MNPSRSLRAIHAVVARIPRGRVSTYGRLAALAGLPGRARRVGRGVRELAAGVDLPWHRVLNAAGRVSARGDALGHEELQAHLLEREGVRLDGGAVALEQYLWRPRARPVVRKTSPGANGRTANRPSPPTAASSLTKLAAAQRSGGGAARKAAR